MFKKKDKKNKPTILTKKHPLDNLYIAEMSIKTSGTIKSRETIICHCEKDGYGQPIYTDLLTQNIYRLYTDYYAKNGETIVFNPRSLMSALKNGTYKDNLLNNGYITKEQLIQVYNALNDGIGFIESREDKKKQDLNETCSLLTNKSFTNEPIIHREDELERLMISLALNKKIALIVGNKGSGTTSLVEELAYLIQKGQVPDFLKNKSILEVNIPGLKRKESKKKLENRIKAVIDAAKENNSIIFIDEADDIVTPQKETDENINIMAMLRYAAEREGIKIIATTNQTRYKEFANSLDFKRQFDIIEINKLDDTKLRDIISLNIKNQSQNTNISLTEIQDYIPEITSLLLTATSTNNTLMITTDENPGLVLSIIDKGFAIAKGTKASTLSLDHIQRSIIETKELDQNKRKKTTEYLETLKEKHTSLKELRK